MPLRALWTIALAILALSVSSGAQAPVAVQPGGQSTFRQPAEEAPKEPPKAIGLITGTVVNGLDQSPIAAAIVTLTPAGRNAYQFGARVLTDVNGRFFFRDVDVNRFTLTADKAGWVQGALGRYRPGGDPSTFNMAEGQRRAAVQVAMWRPAVVSGRVIDEAGEPFVRAAVRIYQRTFAAGRPQWIFKLRVFTDDRGVYRFSDLVPGNYAVVVPAAVTSEPGAFRLQTPQPEAYLQTMTAAGAAPVMSSDPPTLSTRADQPLIASALGMPRLPSGEGPWLTYPTTFHPSAQTIGSATVVAAVSGRERTNVNVTVRMAPTVQVSGTVTSPDGSPAAFHAVHLLPGDASDQAVLDVATAVSDGNGAFTFYGVPAGAYVARVVKIPKPGGRGRLSTCGGTGAIPYVCATSSGPGMPEMPTDPLLYAEQNVAVTDQPIRNLTLQLRNGVRVTGRAEFDGSADKPSDADLATAAIFLERADGRAAEPANGYDITMPGRFSADGRFATTSAAPGRYLIRSSAIPRWLFKSATYQGRDISETPFELSGDISDVVITFTDSLPGIQGTVLDANGRPDERATVLLFPTDRTKWIDYGRRTRSVLPARTTEGGKLTMPPPPDGEYFIIAIPDAQMIDWQDPAFLENLATRAERINVIERQPIRHDLQTRSIQ